jgi:hypothetical protein
LHTDSWLHGYSHERSAMCAGVWICPTYLGRTGSRHFWTQRKTNLGDLHRCSDKLAIQTGQSKNSELSKNIRFITYSQGGNKLLLLLLLLFRPWASFGRNQSDRHGSGTLHSRQVLRVSLPLLSPVFRRSQFRRQMPPRPRALLVAKGGTVGENGPVILPK